MLGHCFYCVQDLKTLKFYNKQTSLFDLNDALDPPFLTLEEAQKIAESSSHFKVSLHENT